MSGKDWLWCPYHEDWITEARWDDVDPAVAWRPQCDRTIAVVHDRKTPDA